VELYNQPPNNRCVTIIVFRSLTRQTALDELYVAMFGTGGEPHQDNGQTNGQTVTSKPVEASDDELLERARKAKNGAKFRRLFDDGDSGDDASQADESLMGMLAFWTGKDPARMERLFSRSKLAEREKWERADYRKRTIDFAIDKCTEVYTPGPKPSSNGSISSKSTKKGNNDNAPEIVITEAEADVNDLAVKALANHSAIYQRNLNLVSVAFHVKANQGTKDKVDRADGTPLVRPIQPSRLRELLTRVARWKKWVAKKKGDSSLISTAVLTQTTV
jgi:hypothetical protein